MRVFLDARDLIDCLQGRASCNLATLRSHLNGGGHQLVLTWPVVLEIAAPIVSSATTTVVTRLLNNLETLPLTYLHGQIVPQEIRAAIAARKEGREYSPINAYVNLSLAEAIFTLWQVAPKQFRWQRDKNPLLKSVLEADRSNEDPPRPPEHFRTVMRRHFALYQLHIPPDVDDLSDWIYQCPSRCPATRIAYEVYQHIRRNIGDKSEVSDFGDLAHIYCLPYVDVLTLDRRMADYVRRATRGWAYDLSEKVCPTLAALLSDL